ncbi:MAG: NADH-quinone oxidoreductase subunit H, partial [Actinobacteria bacterium]|nr:NADH-quinone oxidoreductase subunit H [Actinomycetota bacterium]
MIVVLRKSFSILLLLAINLYIVAYINSKLAPRIELRRGPRTTRAGGISYPWTKFLSYLAKDNRVNIWEIIIFLVSLSIWTMVPITSSLVLIDLDYSLVVVLIIYTLLLILNVINGQDSSYGALYTRVFKKIGMILFFLVPILLCASSIVLVNRSLSLKSIVGFQYQYWNVLYQPLGFVVMFVSILFQIKLLGITKKNRFLFSHNFDKEGKGLGKLFIRLSSYMAFFLLITL